MNVVFAYEKNNELYALRKEIAALPGLLIISLEWWNGILEWNTGMDKSLPNILRVTQSNFIAVDLVHW